MLKKKFSLFVLSLGIIIALTSCGSRDKDSQEGKCKRCEKESVVG